MNLLTTISNEAYQQIYVTLDDGSVLTLELVYRPAIQRWTFNLAHDALTLENQMTCISPNLLRQYRNTVPFGLACVAVDGVDPILPDDFSSGRCSIYVLNAQDVLDVESQIVGAAS